MVRRGLIHKPHPREKHAAAGESEHWRGLRPWARGPPGSGTEFLTLKPCSRSKGQMHLACQAVKVHKASEPRSCCSLHKWSS